MGNKAPRGHGDGAEPNKVITIELFNLQVVWVRLRSLTCSLALPAAFSAGAAAGFQQASLTLLAALGMLTKRWRVLRM